MTEAEHTSKNEPQKKSKIPLIIGVLLGLAGGVGGFYATWSGMILGANNEKAYELEEPSDPFANISFVEVEPMVISVDTGPERRILRFRAQLEVPNDHVEDVTKLLPRVMDVLNSYLRALEVADLEDQTALTRLRAQMLRRVQVVTGQEMVNDFLIMEFVLT
jgi:flagellar FliL protein